MDLKRAAWNHMIKRYNVRRDIWLSRAIGIPAMIESHTRQVREKRDSFWQSDGNLDGMNLVAPAGPGLWGGAGDHPRNKDLHHLIIKSASISTYHFLWELKAVSHDRRLEDRWIGFLLSRWFFRGNNNGGYISTGGRTILDPLPPEKWILAHYLVPKEIPWQWDSDGSPFVAVRLLESGPPGSR
jgi:hypothetical protein